MIDLLSRPVATTPLVGREAHLATLDRLAAQVLAGQCGPCTLLITGEAGIGKSRLLAAFVDRLGAQWRTLRAVCFEPYQGEPYAPLADLLPQALAALPPGQRPARHAALAALPGLEHLAPEGAQPPLDAVQSQRRLFPALEEIFAGLAEQGPLLIAIEDLHWSDAATLAFLPFLSQALAGRPAMLALTYRPDEAPPPLGAMLADLDRRRLAAELGLSPLGREDVGVLIRALAGMAPSPDDDLVERVSALTDGNPFFVEEVVAALLASGAIDPAGGGWRGGMPAELPIPRSAQDAVARRSGRLSPAAAELLRLAAALGRRFDFGLLLEVAGLPEDELLGLLKELIGARLVVEEAEDQFAFRHALAQGAIYGELLARERRALHQRVADAIEAQGGERRAADLARHLLRAGAWERAMRAALLAVDQARAAGDERGAAAHLSTALAAAAQIPGAPRAELLLARADASLAVGAFEAALADLEAAHADAEARGDTWLDWRALVSLGRLWAGRDHRRAGAYVERALERARHLGDPAALAWSLNVAGAWHTSEDLPGAAGALHAEALAIFERLGDRPGVAESLELLGVSQLFAGDAAASAASLGQAAEQFAALGAPAEARRAAARRGLCCHAEYEALDGAAHGAVAEAIERALQAARQAGARAEEAAILALAGGHAALAGDLGRAHAALLGSIALAEERPPAEWRADARSWLSAISLDLLDPAEAVRWGERALAAAREAGAPAQVREAAHRLARAYTALGAPEQAEAALAAALTGQDHEPSLPRRRVRLAAAERSLAAGDAPRALAEADALLASASSPPGAVAPALWHLRGAALLALRRYDEARAALDAALAAASAAGRRPLALRILTTLAALAVAQRRREDAEATLDAARDLIDTIAATIPDAEPRAVYRRRALAALPAAPAVTPRQAVKQVFGGLTDRELDVARLVARGHTNRQIAEALVLSERTVTTHIGHILGKLGFSSRAQVARWVTEKGLAR